MPVTRSPSVLSSQKSTQPSGSPIGRKARSSQNIIVLSDDEPSGAPHVVKKATERRRRMVKEKRCFVLGEVLEISSDDEPPSVTPMKLPRDSSASTISKLRTRIKMLQKVWLSVTLHAYMRSQSLLGECRAARRMSLAERKTKTPACASDLLMLPSHSHDSRFASASGHLQARGSHNLRYLHTPALVSVHVRPVLHPPQLPTNSRLHADDVPSLPDCGHTFCEGCLQDWFDKTLSEHTRHQRPYDLTAANIGGAYQHIQPRVQINFSAAAFLEGAYNGLPFHQARPVERQLPPQLLPKPSYTCPSCRAEVKSRPIEEFSLKAMVRAVAAANGETIPEKQIVVGQSGTSTSFDKFFGKLPQMPSGSGSR